MTSIPKDTSAGNLNVKFWVVVAAMVVTIILTAIYMS